MRRLAETISKIRSVVSTAQNAYNTRWVPLILEAKGLTDTSRAERNFSKLQSDYNYKSEYGYDTISLWRRAIDRSARLISLPEFNKPGKSVLEMGAGDGMLGAALSGFGHQTCLADQEDWRHECAKKIPFCAADCCKPLPFERSSFDLICSYNSFEHFPEPEAVLSEMLRLVKPSGLIHLEFAPLYSSPWGLHAYRTLKMPYPQFLFSEKFVHRKLEELGIWDLGKRRTELQFLNQWKSAMFDRLWSRADCTVLSKRSFLDYSELGTIRRYPEAFRGRGLMFTDVTTSGFSVTLRKDS